MKNFIIWFWYFVITLASYALGRTDEEKFEETGLIALTATYIILFIILSARTYGG